MTTLSTHHVGGHDEDLLIPVAPLQRCGEFYFPELDALRRGLLSRRESLLARWFPPRQLLLRGAGQTAELSLTPRLQIAAVAILLGCLFGLIASMVVAAASYHATALMAADLDSLRNAARLRSERVAQGLEVPSKLYSELSQTSRDREKASTEDTTLAQQKADIERLIAERDRLAADRDNAFADRNALLIENQQVLRQLEDRTQGTIAELERLVASTGIDLARVIKVSAIADRAAPRGGPFVPWRGQVAVDNTVDAHFVTSAASDLERLQGLHDFLIHLPLSSPVDNIVVSDGFGFRRDPFSGFAAMHEGVDLRGPRNANVYATAAGIVKFAGWSGEYGNMVEIDHGFGLTTRYAHLGKALVRAGDVIVLHQKVGLLGSTGRVTGAHLHYEVRVDDRARNPLSFLKADINHSERDRYVQQ